MALTLDQIDPAQYTPDYNAQRAGYQFVDTGDGNGYWTDQGGERARITGDDGSQNSLIPNAMWGDLNAAGYAQDTGDLAYRAQTAQYGAQQNFGGNQQAYLDYVYGPGSSVINDPRFGSLIKAGDPTKAGNPTAVALPNTGNGWFKDFALPALATAGAVYGAGTLASGALGLGAPAATVSGGPPASYWSMLADGGGVASDAGGAAAGTMGAEGGLTAAQQWAQGLGALGADGTIDWAAVNASPTLQSMGAISGDFGAIPWATSAAGAGTLLDQAGTLMSGAKLPAGAGLAALNGFASAAGAGTAAKMLGTLGAAGLGAYGANKSADAYKELSDKYFAMGSPYRDLLKASYDPSFKPGDMAGYNDAIDSTMNSTLRKLSTSGNPFDNPGGLMEANKYVTQSTALPAIQNYRSGLSAAGQLGVGPAAQFGSNQVSSQGGVYDSLGVGLSRLTNPPTPADELMSRFGYSINNGAAKNGMLYPT